MSRILAFLALLLKVCLAVRPYNLMPLNFTLSCNFPMTPNDLVVETFNDSNCANSVTKLTMGFNGNVANFSGGFQAYKLSRKLNPGEYVNFMMLGIAKGTYVDVGSGPSPWLAIGDYPWDCANRTFSLIDTDAGNVENQCNFLMTGMPTGAPVYTCAIVQCKR